MRTGDAEEGGYVPSSTEGTPVGPATLKVSAVARRLGVAPATLRTWSRRYGLGPSAHVAGAHRQYTSADVMRLMVMRRLTLEGVWPADAARVALESSVTEATDGEQVPVAPDLVPFVAGTPAAGSVRDTVRELTAAAADLDTPTCAALVRAAIAEHGVLTAWTRVMQPVLADAGQRFANTGSGVDVEHLLSTAVLAELVRATEPVPGDAGVLLACAPGEDHWLPLQALAAALSELQVGARVMGPGVPARDLLNTVRRLRPRVVVVLAVLPVQQDPMPVLHDHDVTARLYAAGPGWAPAQLGPGTGLLVSLDDAVTEVRRALSGV